MKNYEIVFIRCLRIRPLQIFRKRLATAFLFKGENRASLVKGSIDRRGTEIANTAGRVPFYISGRGGFAPFFRLHEYFDASAFCTHDCSDDARAFIEESKGQFDTDWNWTVGSINCVSC